MKSNDHISDSQLEEYIIHTYYLTESNENNPDEKIEEHLANCDECAEKAHKMYEDLKKLSDWTVFEDNQTLLNSKVFHALDEMEKNTTDAKIKERVTRWLKDFKGLAGGSLRLLMDIYSNGKRKTTRLIAEGVEKLNTSHSINFEYGVEFAPSRAGKKEKIVKFNVLESSNTQTPMIVNVDKKKRGLRILYRADQSKDLPMALLLPSKAIGSAQLKDPVYNEKKKYWEIFFSDIPEGEYLLMFEPDYMM